MSDDKPFQHWDVIRKTVKRIAALPTVLTCEVSCVRDWNTKTTGVYFDVNREGGICSQVSFGLSHEEWVKGPSHFLPNVERRCQQAVADMELLISQDEVEPDAVVNA